MCPVYSYLHPETGEVFEELVSIKDSNKFFILPDGIKCKRLFSGFSGGIINKNAEVFQKDSDYVKKCKPRFVKFRDGHKEKYNPTKHF